MQPYDKAGHKLFPKCFNVLERYGEALTEMGWREASKSPNLFYKNFMDTVVFADMRGTEIVPIWESPCPMLYAAQNNPDWKKLRSLILAGRELNDYFEFAIPFRFSFYESCEEEGLFFGSYSGLTPKGFCHRCDGLLNSDALFCSEGCRDEFEKIPIVEDEYGGYDSLRIDWKYPEDGRPIGYYPLARWYQGILLRSGYVPTKDPKILFIRLEKHFVFADFRDSEEPMWSRYGAPLLTYLTVGSDRTSDMAEVYKHLRSLHENKIPRVEMLRQFDGGDTGICMRCGQFFGDAGSLCSKCAEEVYRCPFCQMPVSRERVIEGEATEWMPTEYNIVGHDDFKWLLTKYCPDHSDMIQRRDIALKLNKSANCHICGVKVIEKSYFWVESKERIKELLDVDVAEMERHHTSYKEDKIIIVCRDCHQKIHHSDDPSLLPYKPSEKRPKDFSKGKRAR